MKEEFRKFSERVSGEKSWIGYTSVLIFIVVFSFIYTNFFYEGVNYDNRVGIEPGLSPEPEREVAVAFVLIALFAIGVLVNNYLQDMRSRRRKNK